MSDLLENPVTVPPPAQGTPLVLKIDVDTYRGTLRGVPRLVEAMRARGAGATFLFSLGPDHTGRAVKRAFRPGFMKKVGRTSVLSHYGLMTLMYGTVLPGPDIGRRCAHILRAVRETGFEVGVHCWDHVRWQDQVRNATPDWAEKDFRKACERFTEIFGDAPRVHGAAGWQMNRQAERLLERQGFACASDCRGDYPFLPVWDGELINCPQLPTTLPTLDELIGVDGLDESNVAHHLLKLTVQRPPQGHVYTLHAELEGMKLMPIFERLLDGWLEQGYRLISMGQLATELDTATLPRCAMEWGEIPGRSGQLLVQGSRLA